MIPTALLNQTIALLRKSGEGASGPVFSDQPVSYRCRLQRTRRQVADAQGQIVVSDAICYLRPDAVVAVGDRALCDGTAYRVLSIYEARGLARAGHLEVALGRSAS